MLKRGFDLTAIAAAVLFVGALGTVSVARAADDPPTAAVVLVSGFTTTTPFTTPTTQCAGAKPRGATWSFGAETYAADHNVYTAPVNNGPGLVNEPQGDCPPQLPASMTINSRGDIDANARALAEFVSYLHTAYGIDTVRFVGHSYGGLWIRAAMRLAARDFARVRVLSITTLGTPHLGSFMADIGQSIDPALCGTDVACQLIAKQLVRFRNAHFEPALSKRRRRPWRSGTVARAHHCEAFR